MPDNPAGAAKWIWPLAGAVTCLILGGLSGVSSVGGDSGWYQDLEKPAGTPPSWVFGPVWSALYLMMGWAAGRLIVRRKRTTVACFGAQLLLNLAWTPVFFGARLVAPALAVILVLWLVLAVTIARAASEDRVAAALLLPYLAWVSYASYLNAGIYWLNR
jgi:translocator protein